MQDQNPVVPKITPETTNPVKSPGDSILVPKIDVSEQKGPPAVPLGKNKKIWLGVLIFLGVFLVYNLIAGILIYTKGRKLAASVNALSQTAQTQDINQIKTEIGKTKKDLAGFSSSYKLIGWARVLPFIGGYVSDGKHAIVAAGAGLEAGEIV